MKSKKLNLLITKADYKRYEIFFQRLRIVSLLISLVCFLISGFFLKIYFNKNIKFNKLAQEKKSLLEQLNEKNKNISKFNLFEDRFNLFIESLGEDANFLPYYNLFLNSLSQATASAKIKKFTINKEQKIEFIISFENFDELMNFFKFIESKTFLQNFEYLNLKAFNLIVDDQLIQNYQLIFNGKFKKKI